MGDRVSGYTPDEERVSWDIEFIGPEISGPHHRVRCGVDIVENTPVAQKIVLSSDEKIIDRLSDEIETLCFLSFALADVERLYGYPRELTRVIGFDDMTPTPFVLMSSQVSGRALSSYRYRLPFGVDERKRFAQSLFRGLCWLEVGGMVHRDLTPDNILWDGDDVMIIDFSHACRVGVTRFGIDNPPWGGGHGTAGRRMKVRHADDVVRACMIVLHVATGKSPEKLHQELGGVGFVGDPELEGWFGDVFTDGVTLTARDILGRLGGTLPHRRGGTQQIDQGVVDGRKEFQRLRREKEARRRSAVPGAPPAGGVRVPVEGLQRTVVAAVAGGVFLFLLVIIVAAVVWG